MEPVSGENDREAYVALYEAHYAQILAYLRRRVDGATARDLAAETFLVAWRRQDKSLERGLPWLYRTATLCLKNWERTENRQRRTAHRLAELTTANLESDPAEVHADRSALIEALRQLPERDREVLLLSAWEQLDNRTIAVVTRSTPGAIAVRLHRARRRLHHLLRDSPSKTTAQPEVVP